MRRQILCLSIILSIVLFSSCNINAIPYIYLWPLGPPRTMNWHNNLLAVGAETGYLVVLNVNGNLKWKYRAGSWVRCVAWSNNNLLVAGGLDNYVYVFDANGNLKWKYRGYKLDVGIYIFVFACLFIGWRMYRWMRKDKEAAILKRLLED